MTVFKLRSETLGGHVHIDLFVGKDLDHLAKSGTLVLRLEEAKDFAALFPRSVVQVEVSRDIHSDA